PGGRADRVRQDAGRLPHRDRCARLPARAGHHGPAHGHLGPVHLPAQGAGMDVERNLTSPLVGTTRAAERLGLTHRDVTVGVRTGDTPASERRRLVSHPPDVLITTPESLFLMLSSQARESLTQVSTVIVDEVHAVADTKRGVHLALSLARL